MTRAFVLHPDIKTGTRPTREPEAALAESIALTEAIDVELAGALVVPLQRARPGWLFGAGKLEELEAELSGAKADLVVVNGAVTPVQQRNLERRWGVKLLDRTGLILEIFGERAQTREGALQVELAHLSYQRSRLVRSWTHLERQRGGLGFIGGPGETQIETDRRLLSERMTRLRRQLGKTVRTRGLHRAARQRTPDPVVALVGYTNAGKSTLFNRLTAAEVKARDMLFATLDPTMRAIETAAGNVILSDTVGFIADLPTQLIAAFRATLEEVLEADLIVHVRDAAHEESEAQAEDVMATLRELGVGEARLDAMLTVHNKTDLLSHEPRRALLNQTARREREIGISATTGEGVAALTSAIVSRLADRTERLTVTVPHQDGRAQAWLHQNGEVRASEIAEDGVVLTVDLNAKARGRLERRFPELLAG